ncbi:ATP-binding cassette domain-containing protein [Spiroplasma turonicum]|uniref:Bacteriocin ABC transporter n=1 Tax=Spiroplasma turonicum TaxID=216946 RepID=A0A0K1P5R9_9MOLU|nr:cysteine peptidase family C39 domain-containing protein [Spiroplasma turonicum]AKU79514.1 bacteriocin ABC transporter [Spiroplasma turonicum]ALX70537.1 bacteriocin ABC transporter [Spiroplasma turonicum]
MNFIFQKQNNNYDCGVAVSCMLINYFTNNNISLEELKFKNNISNDMLTIYEIENILLEYGIEFVTYKCDPQELLNISYNKPLLISVLNENNQEHFILCLKKVKNKFLIADPAKKDLVWITETELIKIFRGYIGLSKKVKNIVFKSKSLFNWFIYLSNVKYLIINVLLLSIFLNLLILLNSNFLKIYINEINIKDSNYKNKFFMIFIFISILEIILLYFIKFVTNKIKLLVIESIFRDYLIRFKTISIENFKSLKREEWLKKSSYINDIADLIVSLSISLPIETLLFVLTLIILVQISPVILFMMILENFIVILISFFYNAILKRNYINLEEKSLKLSKKMLEFFESYEEIKYKNLEYKFNSDIIIESTNFYKSTKVVSDTKTKINLLNNLLSNFFYFVIFYTSFTLIVNGSFTVPELLFYTSISIYINSFFSTITSFISNIQCYKIANNGLLFLFEEKLQIKANNKVDKIEYIEVKTINKYISNKKCITNFNYKFTGNTLLYGRSGVGKTSILKLLTGHLENYDGDILINQTNIKDLDLKNYQNRVIYLGQYDFLFNGTVWANIQQFKNNIDINVFKAFNFYEILENNSIDVSKEIYENGTNLSKGQRQIINFISLFFTDKEIYLIDEPLSNVEKDTAYYLFKCFYEYKSNALIIMCDHDPIYKNFFPNRVEVTN